MAHLAVFSEILIALRTVDMFPPVTHKVFLIEKRSVRAEECKSFSGQIGVGAYPEYLAASFHIRKVTCILTNKQKLNRTI